MDYGKSDMTVHMYAIILSVYLTIEPRRRRVA